MKKSIYTIASLCLASVATAQVQQLPEKVYIHQESQHKTSVFNGEYLNRVGIVHRAVTLGRNDSLSFTIADGQHFNYLIRAQ